MKQRQQGIIGLLAVIALAACIVAIYLYRRLHEELPENLMAAAIAGDTPRTLDLIKRGADPNYHRANRLGSVLDEAAKHGHLATVKALLEAGARLDSNSLFAAASSGDAGIAETFIAFGANANPPVRPRINNFDYCGTPLETAITIQNPELIRLLIKHGADPDCRDSHGSTVFVGAIMNASPEVIQALLTGGADVNKRSGDGLTPLIAAAYRGKADIAQMLLEHGANTKATDGRRKTAEQIAIERNHTEVAALIHSWARKS